jgi:hypothetical protein
MVPVADGRSVIHAGKVVYKDQALALMMEEFTPFGYTPLSIEGFVERAFRATQEFLARLAWIPTSQQETALADALASDAEMAARWRAKPPGEREAHARKLRETEEQQQRDLEEWRERSKRQAEQRHAEILRQAEQRQAEILREHQERLRQQAAYRKQLAFKHWQEMNERGGRDADAAGRARARQLQDLRAYQEIMARIREQEQEDWHRYFTTTSCVSNPQPAQRP